MKYLKLFEQFTDVIDDVEVWTPVKDKLGFYEPKPIMKSELDKTIGFEKGQSVPFFKTQKECKQWCDDKDMEMFQNMDR